MRKVITGFYDSKFPTCPIVTSHIVRCPLQVLKFYVLMKDFLEKEICQCVPSSTPKTNVMNCQYANKHSVALVK